MELATNSTEHLMQDDDSKEMLMSAAGYMAAGITLFLIGFFGFFLNICVIVIMWKEKQLWTPLNIILFNLVCSDFSVSVLGNPWTLISALSYRWVFGRTMCKIYGFFMSLIGISSITTLTVLAFERFVIVSRPFRNRNLTRNEAIYLVIGIWIYALLLTTPPLIGWGKYVNEAANISCSVNWEEHSPNAMSYIIYLFIFGLVIPLVVIIFSYAHIIYTMKKSKMQMGQTSKAEGRVAYMVLLMIIAFLIAWSPYAVFALLVQFGDSIYVTPATGVIPALVAKSSICYNPIIYVGLNSQYRQAMKQLLYAKKVENGSGCETNALGVSKYISHTAPATTDNSKTLMNRTGEIEKTSIKEKCSLLQKTVRKSDEVFIECDGKADTIKEQLSAV